MDDTSCTTEFNIRLLSMVLRTWKTRAGERLKPLGISPSKFTVLRHLSEAGGALGQRELVGIVGVEKATLTRLLEAMEAGGWVFRQTGPADRRSKLVEITEEGRAVVPRAQRALDELFAECTQGVTLSQRDNAAQLLNVLLHRLRPKQVQADIEATEPKK